LPYKSLHAIMIQRVQSIYLSLVLLLSLSWFFLSSIELSDSEIKNTISDIGLIAHTGHYDYAIFPLLVLGTVICVITLISIFRYKHRPYQIKLCRINLLLQFITFITVLAIALYYKNRSLPEYYLSIRFKISVVFPLISIVLLWMSVRSIKKDEELVRSIDRIR